MPHHVYEIPTCSFASIKYSRVCRVETMATTGGELSLKDFTFQKLSPPPQVSVVGRTTIADEHRRLHPTNSEQQYILLHIYSSG